MLKLLIEWHCSLSNISHLCCYFCEGKTQNTATIIDADGVIKLDKWSPPSHGIISLLFKTPYAKGTILYNGDNTKDYFQLEIVNETSIRLNYNIGNGVEKIELSLGNDKKLNDREWHTVTVYHNMLQFGLKLDEEEKVKKNPVLLEKDLNMDDKLNIGTNPRDVTAGFVCCIRRLVSNYCNINTCIFHFINFATLPGYHSLET